MTKLDNLIDRMKLAGRQTAESWLGPVVSDAQAHERRLSAMTHCLTGIVLAPMIAAPVLLIAFSWPHAIAGALAAAALPVAAAGLLAATGSARLAGRAALFAVTLALGGLAVLSGGLASPFLPLIALLPLEAAMQSRRLSGLALGLMSAAAALLGVAALDAAGHAAAVPGGALSASVLAFGFYALVRGLAFGLESPRPAPVAIVAEIAEPASTVSSVQAGAADLLDRLPGLVTLHNTRGDVLRVSGADHADFTRKIGDVSGKGFVNRIHVADRIAFLDAVDSLRRGEARSQLELRFDCPGEASQFVHVAVALSAERDADGVFAGFLIQTRDISAEVAD